MSLQAHFKTPFSRSQNLILLALRLSLAAYMLYAGITKIIDPSWSAAGYLSHAKTFSNFYAWFAQPEILPVTNFLNEWGITLVGVSLLFGAFVRIGSFGGILLMILYYFPNLNFPSTGDHTLLVDDHVIFAIAFGVLAIFNAGYFLGFDGWRKGHRA